MSRIEALHSHCMINLTNKHMRTNGTQWQLNLRSAILMESENVMYLNVYLLLLLNPGLPLVVVHFAYSLPLRSVSSRVEKLPV